MAKRSRVQKSEINPVPLYRSYGVTKKEGFFAYLNDHLATVLLLIMYFWCFVIIVVGIWGIIVMLGALGIGLAVCVGVALVYRIGFKITRKRRAFLRE